MEERVINPSESGENLVNIRCEHITSSNSSTLRDGRPEEQPPHNRTDYAHSSSPDTNHEIFHQNFPEHSSLESPEETPLDSPPSVESLFDDSIQSIKNIFDNFHESSYYERQRTQNLTDNSQNSYSPQEGVSLLNREIQLGNIQRSQNFPQKNCENPNCNVHNGVPHLSQGAPNINDNINLTQHQPRGNPIITIPHPPENELLNSSVFPSHSSQFVQQHDSESREDFLPSSPMEQAGALNSIPLIQHNGLQSNGSNHNYTRTQVNQNEQASGLPGPPINVRRSYNVFNVQEESTIMEEYRGNMEEAPLQNQFEDFPIREHVFGNEQYDDDELFPLDNERNAQRIIRRSRRTNGETGRNEAPYGNIEDRPRFDTSSLECILSHMGDVQPTITRNYIEETVLNYDGSGNNMIHIVRLNRSLSPTALNQPQPQRQQQQPHLQAPNNEYMHMHNHIPPFRPCQPMPPFNHVQPGPSTNAYPPRAHPPSQNVLMMQPGPNRNEFIMINNPSVPPMARPLEEMSYFGFGHLLLNSRPLFMQPNATSMPQQMQQQMNMSPPPPNTAHPLNFSYPPNVQNLMNMAGPPNMPPIHRPPHMGQ